MPPPPPPQKQAAARPPPPKADFLIPAIIVGVCLVLAPVIWLVGSSLMGGPAAVIGTEGGSGSAVDSGARIDLEKLRQQVEDLQSRLAAVEQELSRLQSLPQAGAPGPDPTDPNYIPETLGAGIDSYTQVVNLAGRRKINEGISVPSPSFQIETFGMPRESLSDDCEPMTNPTLKALLVTEDVGPIRVSMLRPAVESMRNVFEKIKATDADLYARINTAGALCVRRIRGSQNSVSSHSFGLAVDLNIDGVLDTLGDGRTQLGLTILADFFQAEGWFWGAAFSREDSMHFEVSREMITKWRADGRI
ncbi:MAG: M15 family metallopeptidase [Gemmobacter sp.]